MINLPDFVHLLEDEPEYPLFASNNQCRDPIIKVYIDFSICDALGSGRNTE
jgi:hypothetical protein